MPTTDQDARALTHLACRLRAETHGARTWDDTGTYAVIKAELVGMNLAHAVEQVLCHATDPDAKTPGAIRRNFTPPKPSERPKGAAEPPRKSEVCRTHPAQRAESCPWCVHRVKAWDETDPEPTTHIPDPLTAARAAARVGKGGGASESAPTEETP